MKDERSNQRRRQAAGCLLGCACLLLCSCYISEPTISKSRFGNLEINVATRNGEAPVDALLFIDEVFVGHLSSRFPVLYAKRGLRLIRIECQGFKPYELQIAILGDPNHQVLNAVLEPER